MFCEEKGQMKAKQLPIDFHEWVKARTFAIDAGIASRADLPGTIRNTFKEGMQRTGRKRRGTDGTENSWESVS